MAGKAVPGASATTPPTSGVGKVLVSKNLSKGAPADPAMVGGHPVIDPAPYARTDTPALGAGRLTLRTSPFLKNYTPQAQALALNTPVNFTPSGQGGEWNPNTLQATMSQDLGGPAQPIARHELGHMYDQIYNVTGYAAPDTRGSDPTIGYMDPAQFHQLFPNYPGTAPQNRENTMDNTTPFQAYAEALRPTGNWDRPWMGTVDQWGNPTELYAGMNQDPQAIPPMMRQFFPQFAPANYQPGPQQPKNTGRPELNINGGTAAPDWGTLSIRPDYRTTPPPPPPNSGYTGYMGQWAGDYWNHANPEAVARSEAAREQWLKTFGNPRQPPYQAPAGQHWEWRPDGESPGSNYWALIDPVTGEVGTQ